MKPAFIINPAINMEEIQDAIYQKMTQARSISECLLVTGRELESSALQGVVWALDSLLEEIDHLLNHIAQAQPKVRVNV